MLEKDVLIKLVDAMTNDLESNKKKLRLHFGNIKLVNGENKQTLLHQTKKLLLQKKPSIK